MWWCVQFFHLHSSFIPHYASRCCGVLAALHPLVSVSLCEENDSFSFLRGAAQLFSSSTTFCTTVGNSPQSEENKTWCGDAVQTRNKEPVRQCSTSIFLKTLIQVSLKVPLSADKYSVFQKNIAAFQLFWWVNFDVILMWSHVGTVKFQNKNNGAENLQKATLCSRTPCLWTISTLICSLSGH